MHPLVGDCYSSYYLMWGLAAVCCALIGLDLSVRDGQPARRVLVGLLLIGVVAFGSKALYLLEARLFPDDDYVPANLRGPLHGYRIPGGIILLVLCLPGVVSGSGLPWRDYGDKFVIVIATMLLFVRLGCFLNGCCFGVVSDLPWAITFPSGSWVHYYHVTHGWIPDDAAYSLPVHPLQLYFVGMAAVMLVAVLRLQGRARYPGQIQGLFYLMFFGSTALLELLRQNQLTLNNWLLTPATILVSCLLVLGTRRATASAAGALAKG